MGGRKLLVALILIATAIEILAERTPLKANEKRRSGKKKRQAFPNLWSSDLTPDTSDSQFGPEEVNQLAASAPVETQLPQEFDYRNSLYSNVFNPKAQYDGVDQLAGGLQMSDYEERRDNVDAFDPQADTNLETAAEDSKKGFTWYGLQEGPTAFSASEDRTFEQPRGPIFEFRGYDDGADERSRILGPVAGSRFDPVVGSEHSVLQPTALSASGNTSSGHNITRIAPAPVTASQQQPVDFTPSSELFLDRQILVPALVVDHLYCVQYPSKACPNAWFQRNCPNKCSGVQPVSTVVSSPNAGCSYNGSVQSADQAWQPEPCTVCVCNGGVPFCTPASQCLQSVVFVPTQVMSSCSTGSFGGNSNGQCCVFPFVYLGEVHQSCVKDGNPDTAWCSTTGNYDRDGRWGHCLLCSQPPCQMTTTPVPPTPTPTPGPEVVNSTCTAWSEWSECDVICAGGERYRNRTCVTNGIPTITFEEEPCNDNPCTGCEEWSSWSTCSVSCDGGQQTRHRGCWVRYRTNASSSLMFDVRPCMLEPCRPECDSWTPWTVCTKSCDEGTQSRVRNCSIHGNTSESIEHRTCNIQPCVKNCSEWASWSECSKTCDGGTTTRSRDCHDGAGIHALDNETIACNEQPCPECNWGEWTECDVTCGGGSRQHLALCTYPKSKHFSVSAFLKTEVEACNLQPCTEVCTEWSSFLPCTKTCDEGVSSRWRTCNGLIVEEDKICNIRPCAGCQDWSSWSGCTATCGGVQSRQRTCFNTTAEADEIEVQPCNIPACPTEECKPWSEWLPCSVTCGEGYQERYRNCSTHNSSDYESRGCKMPACPSVCSAWSDWSTCDVSCGGGLQHRQRSCSDSSLSSEETSPCNQQDCPPDCLSWSSWTECSRPCGGGYQERFRVCGNYTEPQTRICNTQLCTGEETGKPNTTQTHTIKPDIPLPECLVAHLSFDRGRTSAGIAYDDTEYHHDGHLQGMVEIVDANYSCGSCAHMREGVLMFDKDLFRPSIKKAISLSFWMYVETLEIRQTLVYIRSASNEGGNFVLEFVANRISLSHHTEAGHLTFGLLSDPVLEEDTWVHVSGSFEAATGSVQLYVDSQEVRLTRFSDQDKVQVGPNITVGGDSSVVGDHAFSGMLDEFYVFNCSITMQQVRVVADACKLKEVTDPCPSPLLGVCSGCSPCGGPEPKPTPVPTVVPTEPTPIVEPSRRRFYPH